MSILLTCFPSRGQAAEVPWRLALATVLQFVEGLSDRQAADAVRSRLDLKYALSLELSDPGFDHTVLSEFCTRLVQGGTVQRLLDVLLEQCKARGWLKPRGRQRTDATHVLAAVRALNRLECVGETLSAWHNVVAEVAPDWLRAYVRQAHPEWVERYNRRIEAYRLPTARQAYAEVGGADGWDLLAALETPPAPAWLRELSAVQSLRRVWAQQYQPPEAGGHWRQTDEQPPAGQVQNSPYDPDARYRKKRETTWAGYKAHLTETCDSDIPHLLIQVTTNPATTADETTLPVIQDDAAQRALLPSTQLVDSGYMQMRGRSVYRQMSVQEHGEPGSPFRLFTTLGLAVTIITTIVTGAIFEAVNAMAILRENIAKHRLAIERRRVWPCEIAISVGIRPILTRLIVIGNLETTDEVAPLLQALDAILTIACAPTRRYQCEQRRQPVVAEEMRQMHVVHPS